IRNRRAEIENVCKIHIAVVEAQEREGIALGDRSAWIASQRIEAALDAVRYDQVVVGAQRAEPGRYFLHPFSEFIEGVCLAREFGVIEFELRLLDDLAVSGARLCLARIQDENARLQSPRPEVAQQRPQLLRPIISRNDKSKIL